METIIISKDSKIFRRKNITLYQKAIRNYINGLITLDQLKVIGVKLKQPVKI